MKKISLALFFSCMAICLCAQELVTYRLNLVRHPETKKYGYAFKEQNINSPIRGAASTAVNVLGSGVSVCKYCKGSGKCKTCKGSGSK